MPAVPCSSLTFRRPIPDDWDRVMTVMPEWWGGRDLRSMLPKIFFEHFRHTSLIAEHEDRLLGFLLGFSILPGDAEVDGLPVSIDHGPRGDHLVRFELRLGEAPPDEEQRP